MLNLVRFEWSFWFSLAVMEDGLIRGKGVDARRMSGVKSFKRPLIHHAVTSVEHR